MEKAMLTARDILEQLLDNDSDISGSDSGEKEGEEVYVYCSPSFCALTSEQDMHLDETDSCKY